MRQRDVRYGIENGRGIGGDDGGRVVLKVRGGREGGDEKVLAFSLSFFLLWVLRACWYFHIFLLVNKKNRDWESNIGKKKSGNP